MTSNTDCIQFFTSALKFRHECSCALQAEPRFDAPARATCQCHSFLRYHSGLRDKPRLHKRANNVELLIPAPYNIVASLLLSLIPIITLNP